MDNLKTYNSPEVVDWYSGLTELLPVERRVFESHLELMKDGAVLDIGIGGGRTTAYLLPLCKKYTGIDYSEAFVRTLKNKLPDADCRVMDARDLSAFTAATFDLVNFSFNGIDYVDLAGRQKIFREVSRVLKPGGLFFFSTHNKNHSSFNRAPWLSKNSDWLTRMKDLVKFLPFAFLRLKNKKSEFIGEDYALINDSAHNYSLLTFYTTPMYLKKQLQEFGFENMTSFTRAGNQVEKGTAAEDWIFVTATRAKA